MLSQSLKPVHFGFKESAELLSLKISWPSGHTDIYNDISKHNLQGYRGIGISKSNIEPSLKIEGYRS